MFKTIHPTYLLWMGNCEILHQQFWMVETCWNPVNNDIFTTVETTGDSDFAGPSTAVDDGTLPQNSWGDLTMNPMGNIWNCWDNNRFTFERCCFLGEVARLPRNGWLERGEQKRLYHPLSSSIMGVHIEVSWNKGYPQIINFSGIFHYKPTILGILYLWNPPY